MNRIAAALSLIFSISSIIIALRLLVLEHPTTWQLWLIIGISVLTGIISLLIPHNRRN